MCRKHEQRGHRRASRAPKRKEFLSALEERQKDLEQEIADIHDLIKRLRDEAETKPDTAEPIPAI